GRARRLPRAAAGAPSSDESRALDDEDRRVVGGRPLAHVEAPVGEERLDDRLRGAPPETDRLEDLPRPLESVRLVEAVGAFVEPVRREDEDVTRPELEGKVDVGPRRTLAERQRGRRD